MSPRTYRRERERSSIYISRASISAISFGSPRRLYGKPALATLRLPATQAENCPATQEAAQPLVKPQVLYGTLHNVHTCHGSPLGSQNITVRSYSWSRTLGNKSNHGRNAKQLLDCLGFRRTEVWAHSSKMLGGQKSKAKELRVSRDSTVAQEKMKRTSDSTFSTVGSNSVYAKWDRIKTEKLYQ